MSAPVGQPFHLRSFQPSYGPAQAIPRLLARCIPAILLLVVLWQVGEAFGQSTSGLPYWAWVVQAPAVLLTVALLPVYGGTLFTFLGHAAGWIAGAAGAVLVLMLEMTTQLDGTALSAGDSATMAALLTAVILASAASLALSARVGKVTQWHEAQRDAQADRRYRLLRSQLEQLSAPHVIVTRDPQPAPSPPTRGSTTTLAVAALAFGFMLGSRRRRR